MLVRLAQRTNTWQGVMVARALTRIPTVAFSSSPSPSPSPSPSLSPPPSPAVTMALKKELVTYLGHDMEYLDKQAGPTPFVDAYQKEQSWVQTTDLATALDFYTLHTKHITSIKDANSDNMMSFSRATNGYTIALLCRRDNDSNTNIEDVDDDDSTPMTHSFTLTVRPLSRDDSEITMAIGCYTTTSASSTIPPSLAIESISVHDTKATPTTANPSPSQDNFLYWDSMSEDTQDKIMEWLSSMLIDDRLSLFVLDNAKMARATAHKGKLSAVQSFFSSYTFHEAKTEANTNKEENNYFRVRSHQDD